MMTQQTHQHIVLEHSFQACSDAVEHQSNIILYSCCLPQCFGTLCTYQYVVLLTSHLLNGTAHLFRWLRVGQILALTLVQQFLGGINDAVHLAHATFCDDVVHP